MIYAKSKKYDFFRIIKRKITDIRKDQIGEYVEGDTSPILASVTQGYSKGGDYDIEFDGKIYSPVDQKGNRRRWLWTEERMKKAIELGIIVSTNNTIRVQNYIDKEFEVGTNKMVDKNPNLICTSVDFIDKQLVNNLGTKNLNELSLGTFFDFSKPISLLKMLMNLNMNKDSIILDFFSGSATTAHAVMQLNAEDGGNRNFIMVQLPELTDEKSEAYKAGYKNICEIGKERIRRAGRKILEENKDKEGIENLDIGFRVLKVDSSNMKDVYYTPYETEQNFLDKFEDNIKDDRTPEDLLFQVMLDLGISLSSKIAVENRAGKEVYIVEEGFLTACFDKDISEEVIKEIAKKEPYYAVFRDSGIANDSVLANFEQIFESLSPETIRKVI